MIVVTGGAGFIGCNIVRGLNARGREDLLVVDELDREPDPANLTGCRYDRLMDKREFRELLASRRLDGDVDAILHQGACSDTMEQDAEYMMDNNLTYSQIVADYALENGVPLVYASSAAIYGAGTSFAEVPENEAPLNLYGESKLLFDQWVRERLPAAESTLVGLRYFNVYGPHEEHKGRMASMVYQAYLQLKDANVVELFEGTGGYPDGGQRRDFIYVGDVVDVNLHLAFGEPCRGIFNVGTGESRSFNDVANAWISVLGGGEIAYVPFPAELEGKYQSFTEADMTRLRAAGYTTAFTPLEEGVARCHRELERG